MRQYNIGVQDSASSIVSEKSKQLNLLVLDIKTVISATTKSWLIPDVSRNYVTFVCGLIVGHHHVVGKLVLFRCSYTKGVLTSYDRLLLLF